MPEPPVARFLRLAADADGPSDAELLRRFAATRDQAAFELLVWRHAGMAQAAAFAVLRDRHLAEDAAQAAFLALARRAGSVRDNPSGWLYRTARRAALGLRRSVRRAGGVSPLIPPAANGASLPVAGSGGLRPPLAPDEMTLIHEELARLPDRYRLPVLLCLVEGLTHPAAAARLGWPVGTVAGRLSRAKTLLRDRLTRRGVTAGLGLLAAEAVAAGWVSATAAASCLFAAGGVAGVSPSVILLAKGLVRTMIVTKLKWTAGLLAVVAVVSAGGLAGGRQDPPAPGGFPGGPPPAAAPAAGPDYATRQKSLAALRQIAQAMLDYESIAGRFPADIRHPADAVAADAVAAAAPGAPPPGGPGAGPAGPPLLSWRVAVLPFLGHQVLYRKFRQGEPWDSPHNKPLLAEMPDVYRMAGQPKGDTRTFYQGFVCVGSMFEPGKAVRMGEVIDGTDNVIGVAEVGPGVPWTQPADVRVTPGQPLMAEGWPYRTVRHVASVSGNAHALAATVPPRMLERLIGIADGGPAIEWATLRPRLPAETAAEKAELARAQAVTAKRLAELGELLKRVRSVDDAEEWNRILENFIAELKALPAN